MWKLNEKLYKNFLNSKNILKFKIIFVLIFIKCKKYKFKNLKFEHKYKMGENKT